MNQAAELRSRSAHLLGLQKLLGAALHQTIWESFLQAGILGTLGHSKFCPLDLQLLFCKHTLVQAEDCFQRVSEIVNHVKSPMLEVSPPQTPLTGPSGLPELLSQSQLLLITSPRLARGSSCSSRAPSHKSSPGSFSLLAA